MNEIHEEFLNTTPRLSFTLVVREVLACKNKLVRSRLRLSVAMRWGKHFLADTDERFPCESGSAEHG